MNKNSKKYTFYAIMLVFLAMFTSCFLQAMDEPTGKDAPIYVVTSDRLLKRIERWKIEQMKTLLVLLGHQRNTNSQANPLQVSMLRAFELDLLGDALDAISQGAFDVFYNKMVGGQGTALLSIGGSALSTLIEAAEKVDAKVVSVFCLNHVVPSDIQKNILIPYLIEPLIDNIPIKPLQILNAQSQFVSDVAFSPDGGSVLVCGLDKQPDKDLFMWDVVEKKFTFLENVSGNIKGVWSFDGKYIVTSGTGTQDNLCVFDMTTGQSQTLIGYPDIHGLAFNPKNNKYVVTGSFIKDEDNVVVWNVAMGTPLIFMRYPGRVTAVAWSPDGKYIASGGDGEQYNLILWNAETGKQYISIKHPGVILAVAWSPNGECIVSGGENDLIVWNAITGERQISMENPSNIKTVAWSPDGKYIVSGSGKDVIVWNAITGEQLKIEKGHSGDISSIAFSPDGQYLVSGCSGSKNNLILWSLLSKIEKEALRNCTFLQAQLLYRLVFTPIRGFQVQLESPDVTQIFDSLPQIIKDILKDRYNIKSPRKCLPGEDCIIF